MRFSIIILALLLAAAFAQASSQIQFDKDERPVCYYGNHESAKQELSSLDYDPALSNVRAFPGRRDGRHYSTRNRSTKTVGYKISTFCRLVNNSFQQSSE